MASLNSSSDYWLLGCRHLRTVIALATLCLMRPGALDVTSTSGDKYRTFTVMHRKIQNYSAGLDPINERGVSPAPGNGLNMLQAFSHLGEQPTRVACLCPRSHTCVINGLSAQAGRNARRPIYQHHRVRCAGLNDQRHSPAPPPMSQQEQLENLQQHLVAQQGEVSARHMHLSCSCIAIATFPSSSCALFNCKCCAGDQQAQLMALMAAAGGMRPNSTPPPMTHTPPLPSQTPPLPSGTPNPGAVSIAANAAALAAAAAGPNGFQGAMNGGLLGSLEYQAAYQVSMRLLSILHGIQSRCIILSSVADVVQDTWISFARTKMSAIRVPGPRTGAPMVQELRHKATDASRPWDDNDGRSLMVQAAYQAALTQQAAAAQSMLMQQQGNASLAALQQAQLAGNYSEALAAQVAAQLSLTPGYFNNSNINAAAAAAAAAAVQNLLGAPVNLCPSRATLSVCTASVPCRASEAA